MLVRATLESVVASRDRESIVFDNYARAVRSDSLGGRPAYGLWGMFHVMQGGINKSLPFAAKVVLSNLPTARRVTSLALLALDSAVQIPVPMPQGVQRMRLTKFDIDGPFIMMKGAATLRAASRPDYITVFDPGSPGSPIGPADFTSIKTSVGQNFVPDDRPPGAPPLVQYVGVFRNSDWAAPLAP